MKVKVTLVSEYIAELPEDETIDEFRAYAKSLNGDFPDSWDLDTWITTVEEVKE